MGSCGCRSEGGRRARRRRWPGEEIGRGRGRGLKEASGRAGIGRSGPSVGTSDGLPARTSSRGPTLLPLCRLGAHAIKRSRKGQLLVERSSQRLTSSWTEGSPRTRLLCSARVGSSGLGWLAGRRRCVGG